MAGKVVKETSRESLFGFRVKLGDFEVEISGNREEVLKTVEELPSLMVKIRGAFDGLKPKETTKITVRAEPAKTQAEEKKMIAQNLPKIAPTDNCSEAILRVLESDWGKWRPRTVEELKEVLKTNGMSFPGRILSGTLMGLVKKGIVRRWNTNAGYVYILAEKEVLGV
ncbi:MAG: hypothetical protein QXK98_07060 [Candidatus Bathyarchaeia archaeon]